MSVLFYAIRPCNGLDTIVSNGRKKTMFRLLLDTALKTVVIIYLTLQRQVYNHHDSGFDSTLRNGDHRSSYWRGVL